MRTKRKTLKEQIDTYSVSLSNVESQPEIAAAMAEYAYGLDTINQGRNLLEALIQDANFILQEGDETAQVRIDYDTKRDRLAEKYATHRRKAKVAFRHDEVSLQQLNLIKAYPRSYHNWIANIKKFYNDIHSNASHLAKLLLLKITEEDIANCITEINALETTRKLYLQEVGESQEATRKRDQSLAKLEDWMSDFYAMAKIAMENQPQLLESIGVFVRS